MKKRILVTGSNGFTGRYVCAELKKRGHEVYGLTKDLSVSGRSIDLRDKNALHEAVLTLQPEGVIHLAAVAYVDHGCEEDFFDVNVVGTRNLLESLSKLTTLESVIIASSANVYGNVGSDLPITENVPPNPQNLYAESKLKMEEMIVHDFPMLQATIVRPFNYTGVGQSINFLIPKINAFKHRQKVLTLGNIDVYRDFSDVRVIAWAYAELVNLGISRDLINFCSGVPLSIQDIIFICEHISLHNIILESRPELKRVHEIKYLCGDPTHMREVLGNFNSLSLKQTLSWMLE